MHKLCFGMLNIGACDLDVLVFMLVRVCRLLLLLQKDVHDVSGAHGPPLIPDVPCVACESAGAECSYVLTAYQSKRRLSDGGPSDPDSMMAAPDAARSPQVSQPNTSSTKKPAQKKRAAFPKVNRVLAGFVVRDSSRSGCRPCRYGAYPVAFLVCLVFSKHHCAHI